MNATTAMGHVGMDVAKNVFQLYWIDCETEE